MSWAVESARRSFLKEDSEEGREVRAVSSPSNWRSLKVVNGLPSTIQPGDMVIEALKPARWFTHATCCGAISFLLSLFLATVGHAEIGKRLRVERTLRDQIASRGRRDYSLEPGDGWYVVRSEAR